MEIYTDAISLDGFFDPRYTCDLDNSSPELRWQDPPPGTMQFALVAEDPDASPDIFGHWVIYGIPPDIRHLPAGIPPQDSLPNGILQGLNGYGKLGYAGPCPPFDKQHRYVFRLYALNEPVQLSSRATRLKLLEEILPHVIATAETTGYYQRIARKAG